MSSNSGSQASGLHGHPKWRLPARRRSGDLMSWSQIAQCAGYFDEAHLDKDFLALADASPSGLMLGL
jgi:hypothetical protein